MNHELPPGRIPWVEYGPSVWMFALPHGLLELDIGYPPGAARYNLWIHQPPMMHRPLSSDVFSEIEDAAIRYIEQHHPLWWLSHAAEP